MFMDDASKIKKCHRKAQRRRARNRKCLPLEGRPLILAPAWQLIDALEAYDNEPNRPVVVKKLPQCPDLGSFGDDEQDPVSNSPCTDKPAR